MFAAKAAGPPLGEAVMGGSNLKGPGAHGQKKAPAQRASAFLSVGPAGLEPATP